MIGQADARVEACRAGHAGGLRDDRMRPVGAHDDRGGEGRRRPIGSSGGELAVVEIDRRDRPSPPDLGPGPRGQLEQRRVQPGPIEPDRRFAPGVRAVGQPKGRAGRCFDAHRRDRPGDLPQQRGIRADPAQGRHRRRRCEHATGPPLPVGRALEDDDRLADRGQSGRECRTGRSTADDRDAQPLGHPSAPIGSGGASGSSSQSLAARVESAAIA